MPLTYKLTLSAGEYVICQLLKKEEFEVGLKVRLAKPDECYNIGRSNPKMGTKYETSGKIINISAQGEVCYVEWENGAVNTYKDCELCLDSFSPAGNFVSIW